MASWKNGIAILLADGRMIPGSTRANLLAVDGRAFYVQRRRVSLRSERPVEVLSHWEESGTRYELIRFHGQLQLLERSRSLVEAFQLQGPMANPLHPPTLEAPWPPRCSV